MHWFSSIFASLSDKKNKLNTKYLLLERKCVLFLPAGFECDVHDCFDSLNSCLGKVVYVCYSEVKNVTL